MSGDSTFLSKELFAQLITSSPTEADQTPLVNYFFGDYYQVLRKEICELARTTVDGIVIRSESTEFLQAVYELHSASNPKSGMLGFTPAILAKHLSFIRDFFHLNGEEAPDINISGPVLVNCVNTTRAMLGLIEKNSSLQEVPLKTILTKELKWKEAYTALQAAYQRAFLEIKKLLDVNSVRSHAEDLEQVKDFLEEAQDLTQAWSLKAKGLKTKLNKHPIITEQDWVLFTTLEHCIENIKILGHFLKNPSIDRHLNEGPKIKDTLSFIEFQAIFILKAKFLLKGIEIKEDPEYYQDEYNKKAKNAADKAKLENIKAATEKLIKRSLEEGRFLEESETEDKEEPWDYLSSRPPLSIRAELQNKSMAELMQLRKTFLACCEKIEELIADLAATKNKKALPSKDDLNTEVIITILRQSPRSRLESTPPAHSVPRQNPNNLRALPLSLSVELAEENEEEADFIFTPAKNQGHKRHFSFVSILSQKNKLTLSQKEKESPLPGIPLLEGRW